MLKSGLNHIVDAFLPRSSSVVDEHGLQEFVQTTPLYAAVKTNNLEAAKLLLDSGANIKKFVSAPNGLLASPYELCLLSDNPEFEKILQNCIVDKGLISATTVVRSSNAKSIQYGSSTGKPKHGRGGKANSQTSA